MTLKIKQWHVTYMQPCMCVCTCNNINTRNIPFCSWLCSLCGGGAFHVICFTLRRKVLKKNRNPNLNLNNKTVFATIGFTSLDEHML